MPGPGPADLDALVDAVADLRARVAPLILARQERRAAGATEGERLTTPQHLTLLALEDGPLSVSEVAERTGVAVSTATRMLQSLERSGWIRRAATGADEDRRRRPVELTRAGRRVMGQASDALRGRIRELLERLDDGERAAILGGMEALARALGEDDPGQAAGSTPRQAASSSARSSALTVGAPGESGDAPAGRMPSRMTPR
jgi:DNA-binding MarR family transcriptional regulator